jgi:copper(I)-binding protein
LSTRAGLARAVARPPQRRIGLAAAALAAAAGAACGGPPPAGVGAGDNTVVAGDLRIGGVYVPVPAGAGPAALYLRIENGGPADALLAIESVAGRAELHGTVGSGGRVAMERLDSLLVPARGTARLEPGGAHGMLFGGPVALVAGDTVALVLRFRRAGDIAVRAVVISYAELEARLAR